jgi:glycosidase
MGLQSVTQINWESLTQRKKYTPSPAAWEDQVFYFLMLDRFSNGEESDYRGNDGRTVISGTIPPFQPGQANNVNRQTWEIQGQGWQGGTLKGLESKIGYLSRMGITAIWISPLFKQVSFQETYHGYGVQDFLAVDRHFGTTDDLKSLVNTAHDFGIYVILDIILNHSGNVFSYNPDRYWTNDDGRRFLDPRWDSNSYSVEGFNDAQGHPVIPFNQQIPTIQCDGGVWPLELQTSGTFTCKGHISNWDYDPEFREGDFYCLNPPNSWT